LWRTGGGALLGQVAPRRAIDCTAARANRTDAQGCPGPCDRTASGLHRRVWRNEAERRFVLALLEAKQAGGRRRLTHADATNATTPGSNPLISKSTDALTQRTQVLAMNLLGQEQRGGGVVATAHHDGGTGLSPGGIPSSTGPWRMSPTCWSIQAPRRRTPADLASGVWRPLERSCT
jgi:hypothetical protein